MWGSRGEAEDLRHDLQQARARIAELELERLNRYRKDSRTNLMTLDAFREAAGRQLERSKRNGLPVGLALIDIDRFHALNASQGPEAGNAALAGLKARLMELVRVNDIVARTGSDELSILMPDTDLEGTRACAERLIEAMEAGEIEGAGFVTVSVGIAQHEREDTFEALVARAAAGLARARRAGGGRVEANQFASELVAAQSEAHGDTIEALAKTLQERDRYTGDHCESVVQMAMKVARSMGLDAAEVERIGAAALLHDIGKVAIPDEILHKTSGLDDHEWELMREHPVIGERILRAVPGMGGVARIVRHEHERFDGTGYPDGLAGEEIPIGSRIILACDTYHAMTSDRPYRGAMDHAEAIDELVRCAGSQFDPNVTEVLIGQLFYAQQQGKLAAA